MQNKLLHPFKKDKYVHFNIQFKTTKLAFYTSTENKIPELSNWYDILPAYVGEKQCRLHKRKLEHVHEQKDSAIYKHLLCCHGFRHIDNKEYQLNTVHVNTKILAKTYYLWKPYL